MATATTTQEADQMTTTYRVTRYTAGIQQEVCRITAPTIRAARQSLWISRHPNEWAAPDATGKTLNIANGGPVYQIRVAK